MLKYFLFTTLAAIALGQGIADKTGNTVVVPVTKTDPTSGKQMFVSYCATCHGMNGKGYGPTSSAHKMQPTNLTELARNNRGKFPGTRVVSVLEFGAEVPAHGSAEMPVWGPILGKMNMTNSEEKQLRISNLTRYIESIQAK